MMLFREGCWVAAGSGQGRAARTKRASASGAVGVTRRWAGWADVRWHAARRERGQRRGGVEMERNGESRRALH